MSPVQLRGVTLGEGRAKVIVPVTGTTVEELVSLTGNISFEKEAYEVEQGKTLELPLMYSPKEANDLDLSFQSADDKVVSIQLHPDKYGHALVRGLALTEEGKAITVTGTLRSVTPAQTFETKITVTPAKHILPAPKTFAANPKTITVLEGATGVITLDVDPDLFDIRKLIWTSSDPTKCPVTNTGVVSPTEKGEYEVTIAGASHTETVKVYVVKAEANETVDITSFDAPETLTVLKGSTGAIVLSNVEPAHGSLSSLTWTSANEELVKVNDKGVVTAAATQTGDTKVTITAKNGTEKTVTVKVVENGEAPKPALEDFSVKNTSIFVVLNYQSTIQLNVTPANADISGLQWRSADEGICTVSNGVVTGKGLGQTTVSVKDPKSSKEFTVNVTVVDTNTPVEEALLAQVVVAPNPFAGQLRIAHAEVTEGAYALLNASGVVVRQGVLEGSETVLDTADVPAGLYLLQLRTASGVARTVRVVKY